MPKTRSRYMLVDGNALIHRGYHAIPALTTQAGEATNAVYGFTVFMLRAIKELKPTHIACAFDLAAPTFRHEQYKEYKATRVRAAQELYDQIPRVEEVTQALNIPVFAVPGYEADDVLGTLAKRICRESSDPCDVIIVTGDLDTLQLVDKCIKVYTMRRGLTDVAVYDIQAVRGRYGLEPGQMIDFKALRGDPSDNIKGVAGIGEKGAADLIREFGSLDNLYKEVRGPEAANRIKPRLLAALEAGEASARLSYELSKIVCDLPFEIAIPKYEFGRDSLDETMKLFQRLEFKSLVDKLPKNYIPARAVPESSPARPALVKTEKSDYVLVNDKKKLARLVKEISKKTELAIDTESTSLNPVQAKLVGISLSYRGGQGYYVPAAIALESREFCALLENPKMKKVGHNIKYDMLVLQNAGIDLGNAYFDTMIASYLLSAGTRQHNLDLLAFNELGYQMQPISELIGKGKNAITMDQVPEDKVSWYACEDADITMRLKSVFETRLREDKLEKVFHDMEMPLVPVLAAMERTGILLDQELLGRLSADAQKQIASVEKEIYRLTGETFNLNSPKQLKEVLFDKLGLEPTGNKRTKTGASTAAGELEKMAGQHPAIDKVLLYRELSKLQSTYLAALPGLVNPATGRLHTSFNQTVAATGRLSSTEPNLQNIPVRGTGLGSEVRKAFIAGAGKKLLSLDYSQIELRVVAHLAGDNNMRKVFKNNEDIHTNTAMAIFDVREEEVTSDMRRDAKTINFGVLYGLSSFGLSDRIGQISRSEAKEFIDKYFEAYPDVKRFIEGVRSDVNELGWVKNETGRIRKFPEISSSQFFVRAAAERAAINFPIQSLAADIIKAAMIDVHRLIEKRDDVRMLLQVHDELVFEVKEDALAGCAGQIRQLMENAIKLSVPIVVDAKVGDSWGVMEKLK